MAVTWSIHNLERINIVVNSKIWLKLIMYLNTDDKIIYIYLKSEFSSPKAPIATYTKCSALFHLTLPYFFSTKSEKLCIFCQKNWHPHSLFLHLVHLFYLISDCSIFRWITGKHVIDFFAYLAKSYFVQANSLKQYTICIIYVSITCVFNNPFERKISTQIFCLLV